MTSATVERRRGLTADKGMKAPVTVAATGALTLSGEQTIDGYAVKASNAAGRPDRVLALFQAAAVDNGIWDVATGAWTRSLDADDNTDLTKGTLIPVASGNQAGQFFRLTTADPIQPGTTAMNFAVALAAQVAPVIATIASVRALDKTQNTKVFVTGYYAAGDGGGGVYYYDATDTTSADNGGSIIVATDSGRWKLQLLGRISVKQFGAKGDGVTTDLTAIQNCYAVFADVFWPNGTYTLGNNTWTPPTKFALRGESRRGVQLTRTGSGAIITTALDTFDGHIENIYFTGSGNTGIAVASTAGTDQGYLIRAHISECDFAGELAYGINADCIYLTCEKTTFGYYRTTGGQPAAGASTLVAIKSFFYPATTNYSNLNVVRDCIFNACGNAVAATAVAVDLSSGFGWVFENCDWTAGGVALRASNIQMLEFRGTCWMEANNAAGAALITLGACTTPVEVFKINFSNNTCDRLFEAPLDGTCKGINIHGCEVAKVGSAYVLYDTISLARTLPANGSVGFWSNNVSGGSTSDMFVAGTEFRGGATSPRLTAVFGSSTPTIFACSDPNLTISRNGVGDVSVTASHPLSVSTTGVRVAVSARSGVARAIIVNNSQVRLQSFSASSATPFAAAEDTFMVAVYGSSA